MTRDYYYNHVKEKHYIIYDGSKRQVCPECFIEEHKQTEPSRNDCKNLFFVFIPYPNTDNDIDEDQQEVLYQYYLKHGLDTTLKDKSVAMKIRDQCCCYSECHR